ncbi:MAG TPA: hypothetical protein VIN65_10965 [Candidatus Dormibacteraeota bacterium]
MKQDRTLPATLEYLRSAVDAEEQPAWPRWTGSELSVDVLDVRASNQHDVEARRTQAFNEVAQAARVGAAVRHQGAVPVGNARLKPSVEGCVRG